MSLSIFISRRFAYRVFLVLVGVSLALAVASVAGQVFYRLLEGVFSEGQGAMWIAEQVRDELNLNEERNLPTLFSAYTLMLAGHLAILLSFIHYRRGERYAFHWAGVGFAVLFVGLDDAFMWHEKLIEPLRVLLGADGILYFAWVIPAAAVLALMVPVYLRFFFRLPAGIRGLMVLAGGMFIGAALGLEMLGGYFAATAGEESVGFIVESTVEETLEMLGASVFVYALLLYLNAHIGRAEISGGERKRQKAAAYE